MVICDHVNQACIDASSNNKQPCIHATAHEEDIRCKGQQCQRFVAVVSTKEGKVLNGIIYGKCVEAKQ